jgi:putative ABC transport system permease protein
VHDLLRRTVSDTEIPAVTSEALQAMAAYPWPGNIRELDHALRSAVALGDGVVTLEHLPDGVRSPRGTPSDGVKSAVFLGLGPEQQRQAIIDALHRTAGNRTRSAQLLGIARSTLWVRMRVYGLQGNVAQDPRYTIGAVRDETPTSPTATRIRVATAPSLGTARANRMDRWRQDLVHAWRAVRARPGATLAMMLVLALGVGLVTAMFALADPFLFRPLPYSAPDDLVVITLRSDGPIGRGRQSGIPALAEWQGRSDLFAGLAAYRLGEPVRIRLPGGAAVVRTAGVTEQFLDVLGTPVSAWLSYESSTDGTLPLTLTASAFQRLFGSNKVGEHFSRTLQTPDGRSVRIVGSLPPMFLFPSPHVTFPVEALTSMREAQVSVDSAGVIIARLRAGVSIAVVQDALAATLPSAAQARIEIDSIDRYMTGRVRPIALGALGAGALILLVCVGNVANLLLARAAFRMREFATRRALGASRADLTRLVLVELGFVTAGAVASGVWLAHLSLEVANRLMPVEYLALGGPSITWRVVGFGCAAGGVVVLAGLLPVYTVARAMPATVVGEASGVEARRIRTLRFMMAATQTAIAIMLAAGAVLLVRSYVNLMTRQTGFSGDVIVLTTSYSPGGEGLQQRIDATIGRLGAVPGVQRAAAAIGSMVDRLIMPGSIVVDGEPIPAIMKHVTPGYFEAVGSTTIRGRPLRAADVHRSAVVVSESLARRAWPDQPAVGQRIGRSRETEIVGVVRDELNFLLDGAPYPTVFSLMQNVWDNCTGSACGQVSYVVRPADDAPALRPITSRIITDVDADAVVFDTRSIDERLSWTVKDRAFATFVLAFFAVAAISVCAAGLVGIVAFIVSRRTREIAIRVAIGARPTHVLRTVAAETLTAVLAGIVAGLIAGRWAALSLEHLVFGIDAGDWTTSAITAVAMIVLTVLAVMLPARRALALSPSDALRVD